MENIVYIQITHTLFGLPLFMSKPVQVCIDVTFCRLAGTDWICLIQFLFASSRPMLAEGAELCEGWGEGWNQLCSKYLWPPDCLEECLGSEVQNSTHQTSRQILSLHGT